MHSSHIIIWWSIITTLLLQMKKWVYRDITNVPKLVSDKSGLGQMWFCLGAHSCSQYPSNDRVLDFWATRGRDAFSSNPRLLTDRQARWFGLGGGDPTHLPWPSRGWLQMNSRVLSLQDADVETLRGPWAWFLVFSKKKPFTRALLQLDPTFCMPCVPEIQCKLIQPPEFDGAAPNSRGVRGNLLYSGNCRCTWLECKMRVELGEGLGTKVILQRALFSLEMIRFYALGNGESPSGFE